MGGMGGGSRACRVLWADERAMGEGVIMGLQCMYAYNFQKYDFIYRFFLQLLRIFVSLILCTIKRFLI